MTRAKLTGSALQPMLLSTELYARVWMGNVLEVTSKGMDQVVRNAKGAVFLHTAVVKMTMNVVTGIRDHLNSDLSLLAVIKDSTHLLPQDKLNVFEFIATKLNSIEGTLGTNCPLQILNLATAPAPVSTLAHDDKPGPVADESSIAEPITSSKVNNRRNRSDKGPEGLPPFREARTANFNTRKTKHYSNRATDPTLGAQQV